MYWISRLNRQAGPCHIMGTPVEILGFQHQPHLNDNVPHRHTYFEICLVGTHGEGIFTVHDQPHALRPGTLFFARPGVIHQIQNTLAVGMELYWISFAWPVGERKRSTQSPLSGGGGTVLEALATSQVLTVQDPGQVGALWAALRAVGESAEVSGKDAQVTGLSEALILALAQLGAGDGLPVSPGAPGTAEHQAARLAVRYIHDNLAGALGIEEIASQVAVSSRHFGRLFQRFTGTTPAVYVETARMDRARHLLAHTDRPLKDIAAAVGYADHHHFSRVFARRYGKPPGRWREEGGAPSIIRHPGDLV